MDCRLSPKCTRLCRDNNKCRSYMFNSETGLCSTFAVGYSDFTNTFNDVTEEAGSKLYTACRRGSNVYGTKCISDGHCHFINAACSLLQRCVCEDGYSFNPTSGDCVVECDKYGDFSAAIVGKGIRDFNKLSKHFDSLAECMESCKGQTSFTCVNLEYRESGGLCHMHEVAWHTLDDYYHADREPGWMFYQRNCKV